MAKPGAQFGARSLRVWAAGPGARAERGAASTREHPRGPDQTTAPAPGGLHDVGSRYEIVHPLRRAVLCGVRSSHEHDRRTTPGERPDASNRE